MIIYLFFIFILHYSYSANVTTTCPTQLHFFYETLGMPALTPVELPFNFTTGTLLGVPFVTIGIDVQDSALTYANSFSFTPLPNNSYVSMDIPFCWSNITFTCVARIIYGITKTENCTELLDRDTSLGNLVAGRLFIYPDQNPPCDGGALITFFNTTLTPPTSLSNYTYDIEGIFTGVLKNESEAISAYRSAPCFYTDGNVSDTNLTTQFVCLDRTLQCADPRPVNTVIITPALLSARYRCLGPIDGAQTRSVIQVINQNLTTDGIESEFDMEFISTITGLPILPSHFQELIFSQTVRQFTVNSPLLNYNLSTAFGGYNFTSSAPNFPPIPSLFYPQIPCICNFTVNCDSNGLFDFSQNGIQFFFNNSFPIAIANTTTPFVRRGEFALLNDNGSFDPDNFPITPLKYYWIHGFGPDNINISIVNPADQFNVTFQTFNYTIGVYTMVLIVCDGQDCNFTTVNVTAVDLFPVCSTMPSIISGNINETIYLNATMAFDPLGANISGFWIQLTGFPVNITNNDTLLASFNTSFSGEYIFQVNITNGIENCTWQLIVDVFPTTFSPINDPNGTLPPFVIPPNRTDSPIDINQTDIPFDTDPPFNNLPPNGTQTPVPTGPVPFFPPVAPPQQWQSILFWGLVALFMGLAILFWIFQLLIEDDDHYKYIIPNRYIK